MNERIQSLANQAGLFVDLNGQPYPAALTAEESIASYKKFSELLINECATIANEKEENFPQYDADTSVHWYILKHFGLKK